jgi:hypothetical protein
MRSDFVIIADPLFLERIAQRNEDDSWARRLQRVLDGGTIAKVAVEGANDRDVWEGRGDLGSRTVAGYGCSTVEEDARALWRAREQCWHEIGAVEIFGEAVPAYDARYEFYPNTVIEKRKRLEEPTQGRALERIIEQMRVHKSDAAASAQLRQDAFNRGIARCALDAQRAQIDVIDGGRSVH